MGLNAPTKAVHLPGLNGIRAIAAIAVILAHTTISMAEFGLDPFLFGRNPDGSPGGTDLAGFGVSMFFALSGFLITYLLLLEKEKQPIDVKNFYIRRVLRIHPLYYTYLIVALVLIFAFQLEFSSSSLLFYIFLAANIPFILNTPLPLLGHYWSLGVEEQFYLFYPWIVKKIRNLPVFLVLSIVALIAVKLALRYSISSYGLIPYYFIHVTRFQCMLLGAVGAWFFYRGDQWYIRLLTHWIVQLGAWLAIVLVALDRFHIASVLDQEFISGITVVIIVGQATRINRLVNLDLRVFDFLGKISYGLYVIHPLMIFFWSKIFIVELPSTFKYIAIYSLVLGSTIVVAYLSYEHFEKYFLRLKARFSAILSSSTGQAPV